MWSIAVTGFGVAGAQAPLLQSYFFGDAVRHLIVKKVLKGESFYVPRLKKPPVANV